MQDTQLPVVNTQNPVDLRFLYKVVFIHVFGTTFFHTCLREEFVCAQEQYLKKK